MYTGPVSEITDDNSVAALPFCRVSLFDSCWRWHWWSNVRWGGLRRTRHAPARRASVAALMSRYKIEWSLSIGAGLTMVMMVMCTACMLWVSFFFVVSHFGTLSKPTLEKWE